MGFLQTIEERILVLDGAMGTMIQNLHLSDADFGGPEFKMLSDLLVFSKPLDLEKIHLDYLKAGASAIETNTFGASPLRLKEYSFKNLDLSHFAKIPEDLDLCALSFEDFAYYLNRRAAEIACGAITIYKSLEEYDGRELFVLGSIGPSNWVLTSTRANLRRGTYSQISNNFEVQTLGLIDGGAQVLIFETQQDPLELKAAIHGAQQAMKTRGQKLPIMVQVTVDSFGKMQIFNTDILSVLTTVEGIGIDVFGINCSIGPDQMEKTIAKIAKYSHLPISVVPNAGLPVSENGKTVFKFSPEKMAELLRRYVEDYNVALVGGCCGTTTEHIRVLAEAVKDLKPRHLSKKKMCFVSGPQNAVALDSTDSLICIAERLNVRGSNKVREAVEGGDDIHFDALDEVVNEQVIDLGAPIIDVCMDSNLVKTEEVLRKVIEHVTTDFSGAMCLDSFSVEALLAAIEVYPGRPIINSISMEEYEKGVDKVDAVVSKTYQHNPIYIGLATGPKGPGATAEEKVALARQIFEKCQKKYGVSADQLLIDVNAFPIGSESVEGMNFALESLKAIPLVKKIHPDLRVSMGVGNLTNGLAKKPYMRKLLTSVFVDEARKWGMDAAIINPHHYVPVDSLEAGDVKLARKAILEHDMEAFERLEDIAEAKKGGEVKKRSNYDTLALEQAICQKVKDGYKERLKVPTKIKQGDFVYEYSDKIVLQVAEILKKHKPLDFINEYLMAAMKELGDGFGRGEVSLPHLLKSADVMKQAMGYLEAYLKFTSGVSIDETLPYKGTVVIGTVFQDVHSIGKDLVKTLLENYGYRVIDLGVQTPLEKFIETAQAFKADAIGMSALLVQTSNHMITVAKMLKEAGLEHIDILIGGAPVNWRHAAYVSLHGQDDLDQMLPNVFYCPSGMDGVNMMNQLKESSEKRNFLLSENLAKLKWQYEYSLKRQAEEAELLKTLPRRKISFANFSRRNGEFCDTQKVTMTLAQFKPYLDLKTLFSLNWRFGGRKSWEKKGVSEANLMALLDDWIQKCDAGKWIVPQGSYGIFPCRAQNDEVWVYDINDHQKIVAKIPFNVVIGHGKKDIFSVSQYYQNQASGETDAIGLQISTAGSQVDLQIEKFKKANDTESAHYLQGLSDRVAEDMAGYIHNHLRHLMSLPKNKGARYSPGYPALKNIEVNKTIFETLKARDFLKIRLTEAFEFDPPGTTGAVVCFHPDAGYE